MSEQTPTSTLWEQMAAAEYWSGAVTDFLPNSNPFDVISFMKLLDMQQVRHDREKAQEIGRIMMSFGKGGTRTPLGEGESITTSDLGPRQVIRLIRDSIYSAPSYLPKLEPIRGALEWEEFVEENEYEGFDKHAEEILDNPVYSSNSAMKVVSYTKGKIIMVEREALYARPSKSGKLYASLDSMYLSASARDQSLELHVEPLPSPSPGLIYKRKGLWTRGFSRIVAADILEPHGLIWQDPPKGGNNKRRAPIGSRVVAPRISMS